MKRNLKKILSLFIAVAMIIALLPVIGIAAPPEVPGISLGAAEETGGAFCYANAVVTGDGIKTILISFSASVTSGDEIILPATPSGFTVSTTSSSNNYAKRINISAGASATDVQNYIRDVEFTIAGAEQTVQITISTDDIEYDTYYNAETQHYYQFVPLINSGETWISSYNAAKGMTYMGRTGYLATVTSIQEDSFIMALSGNVGWLGGTRMTYDSGSDTFSPASTTGYWYWADGPEKGDHFYDVQYVTAANHDTKDTENAAYYFNWNRPPTGDNEPNSTSANGESCLTTLHIGSGYAGTVNYSWNDRDYNANYWTDFTSVYQPHGYIVEYGDNTIGDSGTASATFASVSGTLIVPSELVLHAPSFSADTMYSFSGLVLTSTKNIGVVTVNVDRAAASGNTITLPDDEDTPGGAPAVITDLNNLTKTIVFASAQSAANVQAYLRTIVFTASPNGAQTVTITADSNTTTGLSSTMKLTAYYDHLDGTTHYYAYVDSSMVTWADAYNAAKSMRFMGMTGYLPTITSPEENAVLTNISTDAAWSGGTRLVFNGSNSTTDNAGIIDQSTLNINSFTKADSDEKNYFYWACGPEAGLAYCNGKKYNDAGFGLIDSAFETLFTTSPWGNNQPDNFAYSEATTEPCMQVNQPNTVSGSTVYRWNDLPLFLTGSEDEKRNFFVEFGGYTGTTGSIKLVANDPGTPNACLTASASAAVAASYTITYNLDSGTNPDGAPANYIYGTGATLPTPTKAGYSFSGWYTDSGFSGSPVTTISATDTGNKTYYTKWTAISSYDYSSGGGGSSPSKTITVTETSSDVFAESPGTILAKANMDNAFSSSVEVKVKNTDQETASFGFGAGTDVYPFDISLYIKGTNTKTKPASGYAVTISLPIPEDLLDIREQLFIVHKSDDGTVATLTSSLKQIDGVWYLVFEAAEFSPYALVKRNLASYDTSQGLPYYLSSGSKVFIGFAANGKYLTPEGVTVMFVPNPKNFTDVSGHWGKSYIGFVTEREIFVGTGTNVFSPDTGMTRAMFATVIGRLYERSYGQISISDARAFTDCNYEDYYGKYVDWAAKNGIIQGVGGGLFVPDRQVTRQEMAAMLYRFAEFAKLSASTSTGATQSYSDASSIASWAQSAALYCQETGIITGRNGGSFAPAEMATRAEVAAIIQRFVELVLK